MTSFDYDVLIIAMTANPGVNPSLTITALAERAMPHQYEQALQGLSQTYTIRGTIARAYLRRLCGRRLGW